MEVVPVHPEVEIEDVPADSLPRVRHNGGRVTDKRTAVEAVGRKVIGTRPPNKAILHTRAAPLSSTLESSSEVPMSVFQDYPLTISVILILFVIGWILHGLEGKPRA
jgi:hypothetical protein